jgi:hypothetical protein
MSAMQKRFSKYATTAALSSAMWEFLHGRKGSAVVTPIADIPQFVVGGILGLATSFVTDMAHHYVVPHLSADRRLQHTESAVINVATGASAYVLGAQAMNSNLIQDTGGITTMAVIGGVSEITSQWLYESVLLPWIDVNASSAASF